LARLVVLEFAVMSALGPLLRSENQ
jgi:hypothetical protein